MEQGLETWLKRPGIIALTTGPASIDSTTSGYTGELPSIKM
jgi:hypothetical protein